MVLIMLLMGIAIVSLGALNLDYRHKSIGLREEVKRLQASQVLLMVPDEQAELIATWLASHPDQTKAMLQLAAPGEHKAVTIGPEVLDTVPKNDVPPLLDRHHSVTIESTESFSVPELLQAPMDDAQNVIQNTIAPTQNAKMLPVVISENAEGVKVISLPNGGIRVTTREGE
jgi:hypothetical protein